MSLFNNFSTAINNKTSNRGTDYSLNECLAIMDMIFNAKLDLAVVSKMTGRPEYSLQYKFKEGKVTIKGKTQVRSLQRFWFEDPGSKENHNKVSSEEGAKALFEHFGEVYQGEEDVAARIAEYKAQLAARVQKSA